MEQLTAGGVDRPIQVTVEQNCPHTGGRKFILILYISSLLIIMQQYCSKLFAKFNVLLYLAFVISIVHSVLMNLPTHICWQRPMTRCGIVRPLPTLWPDGALLRLITWNNIASSIRHPETYSLKSYEVHTFTKKNQNVSHFVWACIPPMLLLPPQRAHLPTQGDPPATQEDPVVRVSVDGGM